MKRNDSMFTFHKNLFSSDLSAERDQHKNCRQKLQNRFEDESPTRSIAKSERSVLSVLSLNDTRRVLRNGAEKLTRTISSVRTSIGTFSQKFRIVTRRRQILEEEPSTPMCVTPQTHSKQVLGRTPTKLYSPFTIETPRYNSKAHKGNKENIPFIQNKITKENLPKKNVNVAEPTSSKYLR